MKRFGEQEVRRFRVGGIKRWAAAALKTRPVNAPARLIARHLAPARRMRLPLALDEVAYRQACAAPVRMLDPGIDQVARDIYWGGGRPQNDADARTLRMVERLCRDGGTFLDIGSYSALFAMAAARSSDAIRAVAFDIVPENFLLCWRNVIANDLVQRVEPRLLGIGASSGQMRMPATLGLASLASSMSIGSDFSNGVAVPIATLDSQCAQIDGRLVIKIDVEGFEGDVFRGGRETLERLRPDLVCELLPDAQDHDDIQAMLSPLGYRFFLSTDAGLREETRVVPSREGRDWVFSCRSDIDDIIAAA